MFINFKEKNRGHRLIGSYFMNVSGSNKSLLNINLVRLTLAILIVLYHSILFLNGHYFSAISIEKNLVASYIADWLNSFHVYAFVFVSGYLFFYLKNEKKVYKNYGGFALQKIKRLIVPYLIVSLIWAAPIDYYFYRGDFSFFFNKYILGEGPSQLWFLLMLFLIFVLFYPLSNFFKKKLSIFIIFLSYATYIVGSRFLPNIFQIWNVFKFLPFFYFGYIARMWLDKKLKPSLFWVWIITDLLLFVGYAFIENCQGSIFSIIRIILMFSIHIAGVLMIWSTIQFIGNHCNWEKSKITSFLIKRTMLIYLFHQQFVFFVVFFFYNKINVYLVSALAFIISLSCSLILASIILAFNWTRFLFGEKRKILIEKND